MPRNAWKDFRNLRIKQVSNFSKSQHHAWMIINSEKKKIDQWENCPQYAHTLSWNVYIWHVLVDLILYGLWTNLLVRSQSGQNLVTNAWRVWSRTFIIQVNTSNIVMSETLQNSADWDCFKTPILQETLKTQNQHQEVSFCIFGSETFVPTSCMCKKQTSVSHSSTKAEIISLGAGLRIWMGFPLSLSGIWWLKYFIPYRTEQMDPRESYGGDPSAVLKPIMHNSIPIKHTNVIPTNIDHIPSNTTYSGSSAMLRGQWGGDQNDYQRSKSRNEACFTNPQSCSGLVVWQDWFGPKNSNPLEWH